MMDPISLGAIGVVLGAVGTGMANEAGKWPGSRRAASSAVTASSTPA
ncbi:hypothetical protein [Streptomyces viridochromogenes]|nr:hypothetical protein [Streptomyces viridochromogenes]